MSFKSVPVHKPSFFFLSRCTNSRVRWAQSQGGISTWIYMAFLAAGLPLLVLVRVFPKTTINVTHRNATLSSQSATCLHVPPPKFKRVTALLTVQRPQRSEIYNRVRLISRHSAARIAGSEMEQHRGCWHLYTNKAGGQRTSIVASARQHKKGPYGLRGVHLLQSSAGNAAAPVRVSSTRTP